MQRDTVDERTFETEKQEKSGVSKTTRNESKTRRIVRRPLLRNTVGVYFALKKYRNLQVVFRKALAESYYLSKMPTYSEAFKTLRPKDGERWISTTKLPLIRFIPGKGEQTDGTQQSVVLKVEPEKKEHSDQYKFKYEIFEDGDVESLLKLLDNFKTIKKMMPLTTPSSKFAFFKTMLRGDASEKWAEDEERNTQRTKRNADGSETPKLGQTDATFEATKSAWKAWYFPGDSLYNMHEYVRTQLKFPVNKNVTVKDFAARLSSINTKLARFPKTRTTEGNVVASLSDEELKQILVRTMPLTWQQKLATSGRTTYSHTPESLIEYLDAVQTEMAASKKKEQEKKTAEKEKAEKKSEKQKKKKDSGGGGDRKRKRERFCRHCTRNGAHPQRFLKNTIRRTANFLTESRIKNRKKT